MVELITLTCTILIFIDLHCIYNMFFIFCVYNVISTYIFEYDQTLLPIISKISMFHVCFLFMFFAFNTHEKKQHLTGHEPPVAQVFVARLEPVSTSRGIWLAAALVLLCHLDDHSHVDGLMAIIGYDIREKYEKIWGYHEHWGYNGLNIQKYCSLSFLLDFDMANQHGRTMWNPNVKKHRDTLIKIRVILGLSVAPPTDVVSHFPSDLGVYDV